MCRLYEQFVSRTDFLKFICRTRRKEGNYNAAVDCATQVISFRPACYEAFWARAKARRELNELDGALADLREAIKLSPKNMELHRFTMQVKAEIEARPPPPSYPVVPEPSCSSAGRRQFIKSSPPSKSFLPLAGLASSTPKKELESEV